MDIENFNQCLQYLQSVNLEKSAFAKYIPVLAAITGGALGFGLNSLATRKKEGNLEKNKTMCCNEEAQIIQETLEQTMLELMDMMTKLASKIEITKSELPTTITSGYISNHFTDIAHKYTKEQRHWLQAMMVFTESLNKRLDAIQNPERGFLSFENSIDLLNAGNDTIKAWMHCKSFLVNTDSTFSDAHVAEKLLIIGASQEQLDARTALIENVETRNSLLNI
ncbi:hypothetical protein V2I68_07790 [Pseudomonas viridiflava]|uniref:Uncharacterized protein n=1 Tax=Pseudomonas viridiflava TaxID=33069 RepID=A0ABU7N6F6_PSEVI|nr:hypothetical protein [Pseudomonas viridiflava]MEE3935451.1 hypothetical protein [Pseudomonas viridiflava]MEE4040500.1 hypothetical protein [Pseudomonas viridiflava]MEE4060848.1 hypothetical protein [Pseudomonas viridiflava]MEE4170425.1 hypothetical protein [Pseudomonas viridiflava]